VREPQERAALALARAPVRLLALLAIAAHRLYVLFLALLSSRAIRHGAVASDERIQWAVEKLPDLDFLRAARHALERRHLHTALVVGARSFGPLVSEVEHYTRCGGDAVSLL
jgi:hypothetical protein